MKYDKLFSYCLKNDKPDNAYQFHYRDSDGKPTTFDWENWIAGKLYSNIIIQNNCNTIHLDLSDRKDKKQYVRSFLDYHYSKYGDTCFPNEIREFINLFETTLIRYYRVNPNYLKVVNEMIRDWCKDIEQMSKTSSKIVTTNDQGFLSLGDVLINIPDEEKTNFCKRLSAIIQQINKPKEFAVVLVALSRMGHIKLTTGCRNKIYRVLYKESGYNRSFDAFKSGINHNIEKHGDTYTVQNSNQADINNIINALM